MADYLSLEQAAKALGIPAERLTDLRSQGQVRGFRDGTSWKFPESEVERLKDELPNLSGFGSGILATGGSGVGSKSGSVLGGDSNIGIGGDSGSDLELGLEGPSDGGSDVNLIANNMGDGSDVLVVATDSSGGSSSKGSSGKDSRLSLDLDDLNLSGSAISHDSGELDLGLSKEAIINPPPRPLTPVKPKNSGLSKDSDLSLDMESDGIVDMGSDLDLGSDDDRSSVADDYGMPTPPIRKVSLDLDDESGDALLSDLGGDSDVAIDLGQVSLDDNASRLELMDDLELSDSVDSMASRSSAGDVLSELDLLASDAMGSGLISGGSANLLSGSRVGGGSSVDDALADDDDLIIADDDDDLVVSSMGSDISIAGDSGINLMSPSDSGLSLESEPLDLAGSSISALDLGAELGDGSGLGSGSGRSGSGRSGSARQGSGRQGAGRRSALIAGDAGGSGVDFQADEEFQLSPSGISLEKDESGSQVIDIEDSEAIDMADDAFASDGFDAGFDDGAIAEAQPMDDGFGGGMPASGGDAFEPEEERGLVATGGAVPRGAIAAYEVPFTILQNLSLVCILLVMSLGGMLMTDMVRNMWAYNEVEAPVSALTNALIGAMGFTP